MKFAKLVVGLGMVFTGGLAQAQLTVPPAGGLSFSGYDGQPALETGVLSSGIQGTLTAPTGGGTAFFTYLGNESGYANLFKFSVGSQSLTEGNNVGDTISGLVGSGALSFSFDTISPAGSFSNGSLRMVYVANVTTAHYGKFEYVIGFNDSCACDGDFDDFVVGVNLVAPTITTNVPEPETYAMLLAGLGLLGFAARRRKQKESA